MNVTADTPLTQDSSKWPEFLTVPEVAVILRVSKMTVYRMVHKHEMEAIRAGRGFRVYSASLAAYIASGAVSSEAA